MRDGVLPRLFVAVVFIAILALLASSGAWADIDQLRDDLDSTHDRLDEARQGLSTIQEQVGTAEAQLAAADRQLVDLTAELELREAELAEAEAELADARAKTLQASRRLATVTTQLDEAEEKLRLREDVYDQRVANAYKHGGNLGYAQAILASDDPSELVQQLYYVKSIMRSDRNAMEEMAVAARKIAATRAEADELRDTLAIEERAADHAAEEVERAARAHERITEMVREEREARAQLVKKLEADRDAYENLVASLETESARLADELAKAEWAAGVPTGDLLWPTRGRKTSNFGWRTHPIFRTKRMHSGIDISGNTGQPIVAAAMGKVVSAGWRGGYGLTVVISHGGGLATLYAHQSSLAVSAGQVVEEGQKIGAVGSTGYSTGPHLHFEVRVNGTPRDPMEWFD